MTSTVSRTLSFFCCLVAASLLAPGLRSHAQIGGCNVDAYVASEMKAQQIPGISFAVVRGGTVVQSGARGLANVELNAPATAVTEFAIASMTKSVTASAVLLLVQDGRLSLDDAVEKYLAVPDSWKGMTVRQLLSHTAGVKDHFGDFPKYPRLTIDRRLSYTPEEYLQAHFDAPLNFAPGAEWAYSGGGYVILGAILEKITGRSYGDYLRDRIFRPLGMEHTHIISVTDVIANRASGYWFRDGALRNGGYTGQAHISGPDVGVMTTAGDFTKWLIAVSTPRLWTSASRDAMWTPAHLSDGRDAAGPPLGASHGLGWSIGRYGRYTIVGHGGSLVNGFRSIFFFIPEKQTGVVVLTNQYDVDPNLIARGIAGRCDPELRPPHERQTEADREPAATDRAKAFLAALLTSGDVSPFVTDGFLKHLSGMSRTPPPPPNGTPPPVSFVARDDLSPPLMRYGDAVVRLAHYKITVGTETHWATLYLTASGRVADVAGY